MKSLLQRKNYQDTSFITGMRAFAAIAVVVIHSGGAGLREFGYFGNIIADFGRAGVYAFLVISGYSVAVSYEKSGGFGDYIKKRLWRIVPLYYFWIIICIFSGLTATYWQSEFNSEIDAWNVIAHILFISYIDYTIANTIIGVEWSIPIEVFWYFLVPPMLHMTRSPQKTLFVLVLSFLIHRIFMQHPDVLPVNEEHAAIAMSWSPIPYVFSYALGVSVYRFRSFINRTSLISGLSMIAVVLLLFFYFFSQENVLFIFHDQFIFTSIITAILVLLGTDGNVMFRLFFCTRLVQHLGIISYGIYLSHMPIISALGEINPAFKEHSLILFSIALLLSIFISSFTYVIIEKQSMAIGFRGKRLY